MPTPPARPRLTLVVDAAAFGGAERFSCHLLDGLADRFRITLFAAAAPAPLLEAASQRGVAVRRFAAPRGKHDLIRLAALASRLLATRPDLVHVNMATVANNRHALIVAALTRRRVVPFVHLAVPLGSLAQRRTLGATFSRLPVVVAASDGIARQLTADLGVPPERVRVVRNGVPVVATEPRSPDGGRLRILSVGRLVPEKGHEVLIAAVGMLRARGIPVTLTIAGDGPLRSALEARAAGLPVEMVGEVPDPATLYAAADVFCLPSRNEGLPLALLEAMMAGLPSVASAVGDIEQLRPDIVVVPPDDPDALAAALGDLANSPRRRQELGARARQRASRDYSVAGMIAEIDRVYRELLAGS